MSLDIKWALSLRSKIFCFEIKPFPYSRAALPVSGVTEILKYFNGEEPAMSGLVPLDAAFWRGVGGASCLSALEDKWL